MNNQIALKPSHRIMFRVKHIGSESVVEEPILVTAEQYPMLRDALKNDRFVEINGEIYNTSTIDRVAKIPEKKMKFPERWQFDSDQEYDTAMKEYKGR